MKTVLILAVASILATGLFAQSIIQQGLAHVYPENLHGRPLSTGEIFRHDRLTGGHPTIPIGTVVRITNLSNHLGIDVLINDRWTGASSGIILTKAAASMLSMSVGVPTQVQIEQLSHPIARGATLYTVPVQRAQTVETRAFPVPSIETRQVTQNPAQGLYFLEFATFNNSIQAKLLAMKLTKQGAPSKVVEDTNGTHHVISDGYFTSLEEASTAYHLVNGNIGYSPVIKQI